MLLWYLLFVVTWNVSSVRLIDDDSFYPSLEEGSHSFDWRVFSILSRKSTNALFSPASLKLVLAVLYEASSGATQQNFEDSLAYLSKDSIRFVSDKLITALKINETDDLTLLFSSKIFLDANITIKESYRNRVKKYYDTEVVSANFSDPVLASKEINLWVSAASRGSINQLVNSDDIRDMSLLLANVLYFKGRWKYQFAKNDTKLDGFQVAPGTTIYIPFMITTNQFYYFESNELEAKILRMPYKSSSYSMIFLLPYSEGGLTSLLDKINMEKLHRILYFLDKRNVLVSIPKFNFKLKASFVDVLEQIGVHKIFENSASFTGLAEGHSSILRQLVVNDILQTSGIEVDEEGTVAHAVTDVIIGNKIGVPDKVFNATHPFLFYIQEDISGTIIFLGKVENPLDQRLEIKKAEKKI